MFRHLLRPFCKHYWTVLKGDGRILDAKGNEYELEYCKVCYAMKKGAKLNVQELTYVSKMTHPDILEVGQRIRFHWHFQRKLFSVSVKVPGYGWRVLRREYTEQVLVGKIICENAEFKISEAGQRRAREQGVRNVHAFVEADVVVMIEEPEEPVVPCGEEVKYNPFRNDTFVDGAGNPVREATLLVAGIVDGRPKMLGLGTHD